MSSINLVEDFDGEKSEAGGEEDVLCDGNENRKKLISRQSKLDTKKVSWKSKGKPFLQRKVMKRDGFQGDVLMCYLKKRFNSTHAGKTKAFFENTRPGKPHRSVSKYTII